MKKILFLLLAITLNSCGGNEISEEQIKTDLIGTSISGTWNFDMPSEFLDIRILDEKDTGGVKEIKTEFILKDFGRKSTHYLLASLIYKKENGNWKYIKGNKLSYKKTRKTKLPELKEIKKTVKINGQEWSKFNLDEPTSNSENSLCENCEKYGKLYTYYGAEEIADMYPGWRLPTEDDASQLIKSYNNDLKKFISEFNCIGGYSMPDNKKRKFDGSTFWTSTNGNKNGRKKAVFAGEGRVGIEHGIKKNYYLSVRLIKE